MSVSDQITEQLARKPKRLVYIAELFRLLSAESKDCARETADDFNRGRHEGRAEVWATAAITLEDFIADPGENCRRCGRKREKHVTTDQTTAFEGYAILELLGHRRLAGYLTERQIAGAGFIQINIPGTDGSTATQLVNPSSVYAITPCSEEIARALAADSPAPVSPWELRRLLPDEEKPVPIYPVEPDEADEFEDMPL